MVVIDCADVPKDKVLHISDRNPTEKMYCAVVPVPPLFNLIVLTCLCVHEHMSASARFYVLWYLVFSMFQAPTFFLPTSGKRRQRLGRRSGSPGMPRRPCSSSTSSTPSCARGAAWGTRQAETTKSNYHIAFIANSRIVR